MPSTDPPPRPAIALHASPGQVLTITLDGLPGAGMLWQAGPLPPGCHLAALPDGEAPAVGGARPQNFAFSAAQAGQYALSFTLQRSWEHQPLAVQAVTVTVAGP